MRSTLIASAFAALALAAPRPQDIEFDQVDAAPDAEIYTPPTNVTVDTVSIQPASAALALASAAVSNVASTVDPTQKRDILEVADALSLKTKRDADCAPQPAGSGPAVNNPDTPEAFLAYQPFIDAANNAPTPQGYTQAFQNFQASSETTSYLGYKTLSNYDPILCQEYCDQLDGCEAFNIYFERDPSLAPAAGCPNPASFTNIKCVRWGVQVNAATATNTGETRNPGFQVVIAGSNGYNKLAAPNPQPGFTGPMELGGAINAPNDPVTNTNTYIGYKFFAFGTGSGMVQTYEAGVEACTAACTAQTAYNSRHPPAAPAKPNVCNQVVVYVLSNENQPQGIYCSMYTESWAQNYATNYGQYRGSDYWGVSQAYAYTNATYSAQYGNICAVGGCPDGSYQGGNCGGWGCEEAR